MESSKDQHHEMREGQLWQGNRSCKLLMYSTNQEFPSDWWNYYVNPITGFPPEQSLTDVQQEARDRHPDEFGCNRNK